MPRRRLFLIDATAFCYRAFYAIRQLSTSRGQPTNAVYGFLRMLHKILKEHRPELLAVCFDVSRKTFRQDKDRQYKGNRPSMPDDLSSQIPLIKEVLAAYAIPVFEREGYEADDIIASFVAQAGRLDIECVVISADKDLLQLVGDGVCVVSPHKDGDVVYDAQKVVERFGLQPSQIADLVALAGDSVDNIPSIPGVTEKKARQLLAEYGSVETLLEQLQRVRPDKLKDAIQSQRQRIQLNKELALLDRQVPLEIDIEGLGPGQPDYRALFELFKRLEFKAFLKDLPVSDEIEPSGLAEAAAAQLLAQARSRGEIFLHRADDNSLWCAVDAQFCRFPALTPDVCAVLSDGAVRKIGHDLKALSLQLDASCAAFECFWFDAMIASYCLDSSRSDYSLANLAWAHLERSVDSGALDGVRALALLKELVPVLTENLRQHSLEKLFFELEMPLVAVLAAMEKAGVSLDQKLLKSLSEDLEKKLARLIEEIYAASGCEFNINSPKQLREVLFEKLKLAVVKRTKTGPSTDEEVLRRLSGEHELPAKLLEYRQLTKLKSTYVDALPALLDPATQRLHTSFIQTGTETGRLSSRNPNLQNLPVKTELGRRIREAVIASGADRKLLSCDYSQIELRILAHLSQDAALLEAFGADADIHRRTAAQIYHVSEGAVTDDMRDAAKRINFGIVYGLSAYGLGRDLDTNVEEAQAFIDAYFATYPGVKEYIERQIAAAREDGFVTTILGRRRYLPDIDNKNQAIRGLAERQAVNTPIQGSASDLIKLAMIDIHGRIVRQGYDAAMVLQVHDELVFDVAAAGLKDFAAMARGRMEQVLSLRVPVRVDVKAGSNWSMMSRVQS